MTSYLLSSEFAKKYRKAQETLKLQLWQESPDIFTQRGNAPVHTFNKHWLVRQWGRVWMVAGVMLILVDQAQQSCWDYLSVSNLK